MQACSNSHALMQDSVDLRPEDTADMQQDTSAVDPQVSSDPSGFCSICFS